MLVAETFKMASALTNDAPPIRHVYLPGKMVVTRLPRVRDGRELTFEEKGRRRDRLSGPAPEPSRGRDGLVVNGPEAKRPHE